MAMAMANANLSAQNFTVHSHAISSLSSSSKPSSSSSSSSSSRHRCLPLIPLPRVSFLGFLLQNQPTRPAIHGSRSHFSRSTSPRAMANVKQSDEQMDSARSSSLPSVIDETLANPQTRVSVETPTDLEAKAGKGSDLSKELSKAMKKTASTFVPRASAPQKNPAVPGTGLYTVFEVQGYLSMVLGGLLSFNVLFPSDDPDIWRLMGMWSVWMFTIPSLRARDCSSKEKDALNYLFLAIPLINIMIPFFWKSFAVVWSADVLVFFAMYAWKLDWIQINARE